MPWFLALLAMAISFTGGFLVLRPMDRAAKAKVAPVQFTILDFLSLTAYFAVPLGFTARLARAEGARHGAVTTLMVIGCGVAWLIWWGSVRTAAKAGIRHPWKRLLMIGMIVPMTYAVTLIGGAIVARFVGNCAFGLQAATPAAAALVAAWLAYFVIARRIVVWILSADAPTVEAVDLWGEE
jgi:hypothetical protein